MYSQHTPGTNQNIYNKIVTIGSLPLLNETREDIKYDLYINTSNKNEFMIASSYLIPVYGS